MPRGGKRPGAGRPKGVPNRTTLDVRQAIAKVAEANAPNVSLWLAEIEDPGKRLDLFLRMLEYHVPKLARMELDVTKLTPEQILAELERRESLGPGPV
jgi:hypothetical protein